MNAADFVGDPCDCPQCTQAGVQTLPLRRDPHTGIWSHGYALKRWYEAQRKFREQARAAVGGKGRHANGFEPLARKA